MAENKAQVRQAYVLLKQGKNDEAVQMLRGILQKDRGNVDAWWLMAHAVDGNSRKIQVLERMLVVAPDHAKAQQMLDKLRAEVQRQTQTAYQVDASHPDFKMPQKQRRAIRPERQGPTCRTFAIAGVVVLFGLCFGVTWVSNLGADIAEALFPTNVDGPAPEEIVRDWLDASYHMEWDRVRSLQCDREEEQWINMVQTEIAELEGLDYRFDLSNLVVEEYSRTLRRVNLSVSGTISTTLEAFGQRETFTTEFTSPNVEAGEDLIATLIVENNRWVICDSGI